MNYIEQFMKDNDIKIDEEFYVINEEGEKIKNISDDEHFLKFNFTENLELKSELINLICTKLLLSLILGRCKIEKIPQKSKTVWDLKLDDEYYVIHNYGDISQYLFDSDTDKDIRDLGNAFLTREEAEFELERRKCEAILLKYGTRDMINIGGINARKYFIVYNNYHNVISISFNQCAQSQGTIYFKSAKLARKAIEECGEDRLKKYVFNVKE